MIRSHSIPATNRNVVQPTIPLLLCVPCVSYARPASSKDIPVSMSTKSKSADTDFNDLFINGKTSIYDKSIESSNVTSNTATSRISYSTAELNRFKNSLIKSSSKKKLKRAESSWSQTSSALTASNISSLNLNPNDNITPRQIYLTKKSIIGFNYSSFLRFGGLYCYLDQILKRFFLASSNKI